MMDPIRIAIDGAVCLARMIDAKGRFEYRIDFDDPERSSGYNVLRHCGAAWSMAEVSNRLGSLPEVSAAADRAVRYLVQRYVRAYRSGTARCLVASDNVKLGGNGLAILAMLEVANSKRDEALLEIAHGLGEYILTQRKDDGDFIHKRRYSTDKPTDFESDYYTGEALFGLLRLYRATGDERWLNEAVISEDNLAKRGYGVAPQSHWMLYALEQLIAARPEPVYLSHARAIIDDIIANPLYRDAKRGTPLACRTEGLLAYVRACRRWPGRPVATEHLETCMAVIRENLRLQLAYRLPNGMFFRGDGSSEVRIDYIQHNISSYLGYGMLMRDAGPLERAVSTT